MNRLVEYLIDIIVILFALRIMYIIVDNLFPFGAPMLVYIIAGTITGITCGIAGRYIKEYIKKKTTNK